MFMKTNLMFFVPILYFRQTNHSIPTTFTNIYYFSFSPFDFLKSEIENFCYTICINLNLGPINH
jgi:hypothetical protein